VTEFVHRLLELPNVDDPEITRAIAFQFSDWFSALSGQD
jgi:hypothetical protein